MNVLKRFYLRRSLSRLLKQTSKKQEQNALSHVLSRNSAFESVYAQVADAIAKKCGSDSDGTFIEQLEKFLVEWGPFIIKICLILITFAAKKDKK